ncbi:MAG: TolC family protein, partial [Bacteroidota bacterium]
MIIKLPLLCRRLLPALLLIASSAANAQESLTMYINQALETNQGIKQQDFQLERSLFALKEAKGMFMPSV